MKSDVEKIEKIERISQLAEKKEYLKYKVIPASAFIGIVIFFNGYYVISGICFGLLICAIIFLIILQRIIEKKIEEIV